MEFWNDIKTATWAQRFVWANVALFLTCALVVEDAANAAMFFLFVTGVVSLFRQGLPRNLSRGEKWLLAAFALYFLVGVVSYNLGIKTRLGWEIIFRDIRFLFAIPAYLALRRYPPPAWLAWLMVSFGAFVLLILGLIEYLSSGDEWRIGGVAISIVLGHLAVSMALVCAVAAVFLKKTSWRILAFLATLAAIFALVLSGTRGAWLTMLVTGGGLLLYWLWNASWRQRTILGIAFLILICLAVTLLHKPVVSRLYGALNSWHQYQNVSAELGSLSLPDHGCINNAKFLERFSQSFYRSVLNLTNIQVVKDPGIRSHGCSTSYVIKLHNIGDRTDWLTTPGRAISTVGHGPGHVVWIVRGQGKVQFGGTEDSRIEIDSEVFRRLEISYPDARLPGMLTFRIKAGDALYLVPVQMSPGEYTLFYTRSSIASRLHMWEAALHVFLRHPFLGAGTGAWQKSTSEFIVTEEVSPVVARYDHAHNDYLTMLADRGLLGLASLLLLYGVPIWIFWGILRRGWELDRSPAAAAGLLMVGGFMVSGLTETLFNHSIVITYYSLFISILIVLARQQANTDKEDHARNL